MAETILGKVCPTPKGVYNALTKYEKLDVVQYEGSSYMVLKDCTAVIPSEGEYYMLLSGIGKSAYQAAIEAGFTGTEAEFNTLMGSISNKQDKIIGTVGQLVGFDSMGLAKAAHWWSNDNLLINSDFRKPVNQNGKTEYRTQGVSIDRWSIDKNNGDCVLYVMDGFIRGEKIASSSTSGPVQSLHTTIINIAELAGKTVTFSMLRRGTGISQIVFTANGNVIGTKGNLVPSDNWVLDSFTMDIPANAATGAVFVYFDTNPATTGYTDFKAAKLEFGSIQTLAHKDEDGDWILNDSNNYDLQYALCGMYSPITDGWVGSQHSNPNLLYNWYFVDPINQRGQTEYTAPDYTIDRFILQSVTGEASIKIEDGCVKLYAKNNDGLLQRFEIGTLLYDTVYTCSILTKNHDLLTVTVKTPPPGNTNVIVVPYPGTIWNVAIGIPLDNRVGYCWPAVTYNQTSLSEIDIVAIKLELGPVQTLAHQDADGNWVLNDPPPNKALELLKCQQYYLGFSRWEFWPIVDVQQNYIDFSIPVPVKMRTAPSIHNLVSNWLDSSWSLSAAINGSSVIRVRAYKENHGLTAPIPAVEANDYAGLSADL